MKHKKSQYVLLEHPTYEGYIKAVNELMYLGFIPYGKLIIKKMKNSRNIKQMTYIQPMILKSILCKKTT